MKNNPLEDIVKCDIEISSPASNDETFDKILLVVPGPSSEGTLTIGGTIAVSTAEKLLDYGFTAEDDAYIAASVAFAQSPSPDELYVAVRKTTMNDTTYEDVATVLERANAEREFYGIHLTSFKDATDVKAAVTWAEKNEKLFGFEYTDLEACPVSDFEYYRSFGVYSGSADGYASKEQPDANKYAALAWMAKCFGYDPGTETWNLKEAASIVPSKLSAAEKKSLTDININRFLRYAGSNTFVGGTMLSGEWIDVIRFRDWLKSEMQTRVFKVLKANKKVPYTDSGIGLIEGAMDAVLKDGQDVGGIVATEYDDDGNASYGYTVSVPKVSDLTTEDRKSRKLIGCTWSAKLAGAIHLVEINGTLTF